MLDPRILRDEPERIRQMLKYRNADFDFDGLVRADKARRQCMSEADEQRQKRNKLGVQISEQKKLGQDVTLVMAEMKRVSSALAGLESAQQRADAAYAGLARTVPNMLDASVPVGDEKSNREVRRWGDVPEFEFAARNHVDLMHERDLADIERAAKVSGARFYYLKGDLVRLNQALINYALDFLAKKDYSLVQPPYMINRKSMEGATIAEEFDDVIYKIQDDDLYLIGTSEHALAAMHQNEILDGKALPVRYAGISPCFRREAGSHGRDQKGIFRVHQFDKIEQFVFSRPEDSQKEHEKMIRVAEEFYRALEIPHRVVLLSSQDMGKTSAKTYDIEGWMAGQNAYREVVSCSNCLDFQSRRLAIRFRDSTDAETQYVHTLNGTVVATTRILVAILENLQTASSKIGIPAVLQDYMGQDSL